MDATVTMLPNFDMVRFEGKKICDQRFKHKEGCEWQFKYTKAEFQAFHRNKRVWEHISDYYTIDSNYPGMGENLYKDEKIFKNLNSLQNQSGKIF